MKVILKAAKEANAKKEVEEKMKNTVKAIKEKQAAKDKTEAPVKALKSALERSEAEEALEAFKSTTWSKEVLEKANSAMKALKEGGSPASALKALKEAAAKDIANENATDAIKDKMRSLAKTATKSSVTQKSGAKVAAKKTSLANLINAITKE